MSNFTGQKAEALLYYREAGLKALYNPHAATGKECGCNGCFCCAAYQVLKEQTNPYLMDLCSKGVFNE